MFTSRAEYRLLLRADNADTRLTELGRQAGLVGDERYEVLQRKVSAIETGLHSLRSFALPNKEWAERGFAVKPSGEKRSAEEILSVPNAALEAVELAMAEVPHGWKEGQQPGGAPLPALGRESVEISVKYAKYLERQEKEVERISLNGHARIPGDFDYAAIPCLSTEEVEKLTKRQPATLKDAGDIPGITPKALLYVYSTLSKRRRPDQLGEPSEAELV